MPRKWGSPKIWKNVNLLPPNGEEKIQWKTVAKKGLKIVV